jgi:surface protein
MRKNRHNNGYIGIFENKNFDGILSPCKNYLLDADTDPVFTDQEDLVLIPRDGGGYGATASCTLKNGELAAVSVLNTGGGYTFNPLVYIVPPSTEPYPIWCTITRTSNTITNITPNLPLKDIILESSGTAFPSTPTITIGPSTLTNASFTGSISGQTLNVTAVSSGILQPRAKVTGSGIDARTIILDYGPGATGRIGDYTVNISQTRASASASTDQRATATAIMSGSILAGISLTYNGLYNPNSTLPTITFSTTPEIPPSAYVVFNTFAGYTAAPNVINLSGGTATFSTAIRAEIDTIDIIQGGTGYTSEPTVEIDSVNTIKSNVRSIISGGSVVGITYSNISEKFAIPPNITIGGYNNLPTLTPGEEKLVANIAVYKDGSNSNIVSFNSSPVNIDWGDGTTGAIFNGGPTYAFKTYTDETFDGLTLDSQYKGFKTVTMTLTPYAGASLTHVNFTVLHPVFGSRGSNLLEVNASGPGLTGIRFMQNTVGTVVNNHRLMRSLKIIGNHNISVGNYMASNMRQLEEFEISDFSKFTDTTGMFTNATSLRKFPKNINLLNCTVATSMFTGCSCIKSFGHLNVPKVTSMNFMFSACTSLRKIEKITTTSSLTTLSFTFSNCTSLKSVPLFDTSYVTDMSSFFGSSTLIENIPAFNTGRLTSMDSIFSGCSLLKEFPHFDFGKVTTAGSAFASTRVKKLPPYNFTSLMFASSMFSGSDIEDVSDLKFPRLSTADSMFNGCKRLVKIPTFDSPHISTVAGMFSNCNNLEIAPVVNFSNVTDASNYLNGCSNIEYVPDLYLPKATTIQRCLNSTIKLKKAPRIYAPLCLDYTSAFSTSGVEVISGIDFTPIRGTIATSAYSSLFSTATSITQIMNCGFSGSTGSSNTNIFSSIFTSVPNLTRLKVYGMSQSFTLPNPNKLGFTALNEIYTDLPVVGASGSNAKTITVTGSQGVANDNPNIAIYKGWAVSG